LSCEAETVAVLREAGHRLTPQRLVILSILRHAQGHVTAAEILESVRQQYPYVDISTVYRTMSALKELHLVSETDMGTGEHSYEWTMPEPHHHLICRDCGAEISLDNKYLRSIGRKLLKDYGFRAEPGHFAIFGLCQTCAQQGTGDSD
jgi:Fur family transcriptional regulator, ferric uptake regulator